MSKIIQFCETMSKISEAFGTTKDMNVLLKLIVDSAVDTHERQGRLPFSG